MITTEKEFNEKYDLVINHFERANNPTSVADEDICSFGGYMFETYGQDFEYVKQMALENRVITIVEGDTETQDAEGDNETAFFFTDGLHLVNRWGYLVTTEPIKENFNFIVE